MPRKSTRRHAGTRERRRQIIRAALACFVECGFTNTTLQDIRQRSNASNGSIYHHFSSKEMLAAAVYLEGLAAYQNGFLAELERNPEARAGIHAMVSYHIEWVCTHPEWARFLVQMRHAEFMKNTEASLAELNRLFLRKVYEWVKSQTESGAIRRLPTELLVPLIMGPCQEYVQLWLAGQARGNPSTAREELAQAAWLAVRGEKT